jgi:GST-like protein
MLTVLYNPGCGSAIVEAALEWSRLPYEVEEVDPWKEGPKQDRLRAVNPLLQVPTLLLPDGSVMTESAAMVLYVADRAPEAGLVPAVDDPTRPTFLRWFIFLVAAIYPTFTYGDDPSRYVTDEAAKKELRERTDTQRQGLWRQMEAAAAGGWFLGARFSAIDLYVWAMVRWRPRRAWFTENCPKLAAIADALDAEPRLAQVKARNFP